jgi:hypothetical protein
MQMASMVKKINHAGIELNFCRKIVNRPHGFKVAQAFIQ